MRQPTLAEVGRFISIVFGVLLIVKLARVALFDGAGEDIGGGVIAVAIGVAVAIMGGWLKRRKISE
mgnify:FL=1